MLLPLHTGTLGDTRDDTIDLGLQHSPWAGAAAGQVHATWPEGLTTNHPHSSLRRCDVHNFNPKVRASSSILLVGL